MKAVRERQACDRYLRLGTYLHCTYTIPIMVEGLGVKGTAEKLGKSETLPLSGDIHI